MCVYLRMCAQAEARGCVPTVTLALRYGAWSYNNLLHRYSFFQLCTPNTYCTVPFNISFMLLTKWRLTNTVLR